MKPEDVACSTKRRYPSRAQAKKSLKAMNRQGVKGLVIYECWVTDGDHYHLGHTPGNASYKRAGRLYG